MAMKKSLTTFFFCLPIVTCACQGYVIGYKGINDVFDSKAFNEYAIELIIATVPIVGIRLMNL